MKFKIYKLVVWLLERVKDWEFRLKPKTHPFKMMKPDHVIEFVFELGGVKYYTLYDAFNAPCMRMQSAIGVVDEWQNRITNEMLKKFISGLKQSLIVKDEEVNLSEAYNLVSMMDERVNWTVPTSDVMIKMASILFFDENESPYEYDEAYCLEVKLARWKKEKIDSFFLYGHLRTPLGLPNISPDVLLGAMKVYDQMNALHHKTLKRVSP